MRGLLYKIVIVYIDDLITGSKDFPQMMERLRLVFQRLREAGLKIKPEKCNLFQTNIKFLGHMVSEAGISTDPDKIEAVKNWPTPTTAKEIHSFLGLAAYYRKFIKNFAAIAQPLYQLINLKSKDFVWTEVHDIAFNSLKNHLISETLLAYPDYTPPV